MNKQTLTAQEYKAALVALKDIADDIKALEKDDLLEFALELAKTFLMQPFDNT